MQLSGNNLLIASQQMPKQAPAQPRPQAAFSAALESERGAGEASFEPMAFKAVDPPAKAATASPAASYDATGRPGSNIDIRV